MHKKYFHSWLEAKAYIKNNGLFIVVPFRSTVQYPHCKKIKVWSVLV